MLFVQYCSCSLHGGHWMSLQVINMNLVFNIMVQLTWILMIWHSNNRFAAGKWHVPIKGWKYWWAKMTKELFWSIYFWNSCCSLRFVSSVQLTDNRVVCLVAIFPGGIFILPTATQIGRNLQMSLENWKKINRPLVWCSSFPGSLTVRPWKWMVGSDEFPFGIPYFQGRTVKLREGSF